MTTKKILCPVDFSTLARDAVEYATSLAHASDATLLIVHVQEPPVAYYGGEFYYGIEMPEAVDLERMLKAVVPADPYVK